MTPEQHAEWDVKEAMLRSERMAKEAGSDSSWQGSYIVNQVAEQRQPVASRSEGDQLWEATILERLRRKSQ